MLSTWKTAPALAAGCTVVLKPAEWSPLSCSLLADLAHEAGFPPGVFNVVQGIGEEVGAALVRHPLVRRIALTGSVGAAREIGQQAARNVVPFTGELGGKNPFIVFADADLEAAARKAAGQYDDAGQVCLSGTRILVEEPVADEFLELLPPLRRRARARRSARRRDDGDPAHPPRPPRPGRGLRRARARGGRRDPARRPPRRDRRAVLRADADPARAPTTPRSSRTRSSGRCCASRPSATRPRPSRSPTPPSTASPGSSTRARWAARTGWAGRCASGTVWVNTFLVRDLTAPFGGMKLSGVGPRGRRLRARLLLGPQDAADPRRIRGLRWAPGPTTRPSRRRWPPRPTGWRTS